MAMFVSVAILVKKHARQLCNCKTLQFYLKGLQALLKFVFKAKVEFR